MRAGQGAALALLAAAAGCPGSCSPSTPFQRRGAEPEAVAPPFAAALRVLHVGDMGDDTRQQRAVAQGIAAAHRRAPFDMAISAGDNLYPCGPDVDLPGAAACAFGPDGSAVARGYAAPADPRFELLERPLQALARGGLPVPLHPALGNHDVASWTGCGADGFSADRLSRTRACLEVAHRSPRWQMPGRHYLIDAGPARFVFVDSNLLRGDYGGFRLDAEVELVRSATAGCVGRPCFLVAHHPPASAGGHRDELAGDVLSRLGRLEDAAAGRVAAWLVGHDHDLQHLRAPAGEDVFVSGNGSRGRSGERFETASPPGAVLHFGSTAWGFGVLEVAEDGGWRYRFEDQRGEAIGCCQAQPGGRCRPVACR